MSQEVVPKRLVLQVHVTSACDSRCAHCYQRDIAPYHMSAKDFRLLMEQFSDLVDRLGKTTGEKPSALVTITGGEPLIHPDFRQLVFSVWAHGFDVAVLTNGHLIDKSTAVLLRNARFVQVSLDGNRDAHDKVRGEGDFDRVMSAIRTLKDANANAIVSFTAHANNYRTLAEAARDAKRAGANRFWSDRYLPLGESPLIEPMDLEQTLEYLKIMGDASDKRRGIVMRHRALQFMCGGPAYKCHAGREILAVTEECQVLPCRRLPIPCGDFRDKSLVEIYESEDTLVALRETRFPEACKDCEHVGDCGGGLRCLSAAVTGDWNAADPGCPIAHDVDAGALAKYGKLKRKKLKKVKLAPPRFRGPARVFRMFKNDTEREVGK